MIGCALSCSNGCERLELQRLTLESQALRKVHDQLQARKAELTAVAGYDEQRMKVDGPPRRLTVERGA